jgi:HAD domain in Swiss Army Knife RNA repair proteins
MLTLLQDIDGVLAPTRPAPDSLEVTIEGIDRGVLERYRIHYRPVILAGLEELRTSGAIEIVVLSTWLDMPTMLEELSSAIGLTYDRLLTGPYVGGWGLVERNWKRRRAVEDIAAHPGRVYVWVDDELGPDDRASIRALGSKHTLIAPREEKGLTTAHLERIRALALKNQGP